MIVMTDLSLYTKIASLPDSLKSEVINFIEFLRAKKTETKPKTRKGRVFGYAKGSVTMKPDFDAPIEDFKEYI